MNASQDQTDRVDRARWMESCGARDDSPSWNLGREKQGDKIRVGGTSPRGRGQEDVEESEQGSASECSKVKYKAKPLNGMPSWLTRQPWESAAGCKTKENDASVTRLPGNDESSKNNPISEEEELMEDA